MSTSRKGEHIILRMEKDRYPTRYYNEDRIQGTNRGIGVKMPFYILIYSTVTITTIAERAVLSRRFRSTGGSGLIK